MRMMALLYGSVLGRLVSVVAEFGVADLCADGPRSVDELASAVDADPDTLYRMLRALASAGVFTEVAPRSFALTDLATTLCSEVPGSMRDHARNWGSAEYLHTLVGLGGALRTGRPSFDTHHGVDFWSYLGAHPRRAGRHQHRPADDHRVGAERERLLLCQHQRVGHEVEQRAGRRPRGVVVDDVDPDQQAHLVEVRRDQRGARDQQGAHGVERVRRQQRVPVHRGGQGVDDERRARP